MVDGLAPPSAPRGGESIQERMSFIKYLLPILYVLGLYSAYMAGFLYRRTSPAGPRADSASGAFRLARTTLFLLFLVAIPTTLQFFFPVLLPLFERDTARFLSGEWWRIITPIFFQDGGIRGAIFNLVSLALVGFVAEQYRDSRSMLVIFFGGGIVGNLVGLAWQPIGAGNSVANFSLAASIAVICLMRRAPGVVQIAALLALAADVLLVLLRDIHGPAALTGALLALLLSRMTRRRQETPE